MKYYFEVINKISLAELLKKIKRRYFGDKEHERIVSILRSEYSHMYKTKSNVKPLKNTTKKTSQNIWVMWWQGENNMPEVIKICYNSILHASKGYQVNLITKENVKDYVKIPEFIWDKFENGIIGIAHLSDIIRFSLINEHGGMWIDATTLITSKDLSFHKGNFFTLKFKTKSQSTPTKGRWSITIIGGTPNYFFDLMQKLLIEYWRKNDRCMKYFLTDYFILLLYKDIPEIRELIDCVPFRGTNYKLKTIVNESFDLNVWNKLLNISDFHTLTRNRNYNMTKSNNLTFYGYVANKFTKINL